MIKDLSIIFPSYNEEKRLKNTFKQILKFKKKLKKRRLEVIFVDDGSCDNSQNLINNFRENQKKKGLKIQSILFEKNIGKGFALKKGIQKCTMKWVLTSDVDLSVPLDQVLKWEDSMLIKKNKIYFGSRNLSDSKVIKKKYRYVLGAILNFLTKKILNTNIKDTQCGFKLYEKSKAKKLFSNMMVKGFAHDLELVLIARKLRFSIKELPIKWTHKDGSKVNIFFEPIKMFLTLLFLKVKYF